MEKERDHFENQGAGQPLRPTCYTCELKLGTGVVAAPYYTAIADIERRTGQCYLTWMNQKGDPLNWELVSRMREIAGIPADGGPPSIHYRKNRRDAEKRRQRKKEARSRSSPTS